MWFNSEDRFCLHPITALVVRSTVLTSHMTRRLSLVSTIQKKHNRRLKERVWCFEYSSAEGKPTNVHFMTEEKSNVAWLYWIGLHLFNTLRSIQDGHHFPDDILKYVFSKENAWILITISLRFVPKDSINNIPSSVHIMAWRRSGDKPLSGPMMALFKVRIYAFTRPQWINDTRPTVQKQHANLSLIYLAIYNMSISYIWRSIPINSRAPVRSVAWALASKLISGNTT